VDFLLVLIKLFSLDVTSEALRANIGSKSAISLQRGPVDPKFQVEGVAPTKHSSQKTRLNDLSYDVKSGLIFLLFCHNAVRNGIPCSTERNVGSIFLQRKFFAMKKG